MEHNNVRPPDPERQLLPGKLAWPVLAVRVHPDDMDALDRIATASGTKRSLYVRSLLTRHIAQLAA